MQRHISLLLLALGLSIAGRPSLAQSSPASSPGSKAALTSSSAPTPSQSESLVSLATTKTAMNAGAFGFPLKCDPSGNLYLLNSMDGVPGIHKLNPDGKRVAVVAPKSADRSLKIAVAGYFSIAANGDIYQYVNSWDQPHHLVFVHAPDGAFKSYLKLQESFPWTPAQIAVFPSGKILVTGLEYDHDRSAAKWPFTGIFSADGALLHEVKLADDAAIHDMAAAGDSRVTAPEAPGSNLAVGLGQADLASDGNVYVMRRVNPAIVYAISQEGKVVRRFTVDAGQDYLPYSMHVAGSRIAIQLAQPQNGDHLIKVVDLEGRELATYHLDRTSNLGFAIACYTSNPDRFTFLGETDDGQRLTLNVAGLR